VRTGPAARPACAPALQAFRCVGAWVCAHTHGKRASLVRTAAAPPFCLPCPPPRPPSHHSFGQLAKNLPLTVQPTPPTNFGLVFRSPQTLTLSGLWGAHEQYLSDRGHPDMQFCVCGSPRGDLSHIASLTLGCSWSDFFRSQSRAQDHTCGG
jgi:hypothetical protein